MTEPQSEEIHKTTTLPFDSKYLYSLFYVVLLSLIVMFIRKKEQVLAYIGCRKFPEKRLEFSLPISDAYSTYK